MLIEANKLNRFKIQLANFFIESHFSLLVSLFVGVLTVLAFAPFNQVWIIYLIIAFIFFVWSLLPAKRAFVHGWFFGLGMQGVGIGWIFYSLHYHGGSPAFFAIFLVFLLASCLAIFTALMGFSVNRFCKSSNAIKFILLYPMAWALFEWLQGFVLTGFSWQQLGYTQIDLPLSGFAPLIGGQGVSLLVAMTAGAVVLFFLDSSKQKNLLLLIFSLWLSGFLLKQITWTEPTGDEINIALIQGNIPQSLKWKRESRIPTLQRYLSLSLEQRDVDLIIWPETAIPGFQHQLKDYIDDLRQAMEKTDTDLLTGIFIKDGKTGRYYNSLINVNGGEYHKRHLVPLGEYIPLRFLIDFFNRFVKIPLSDIDFGADEQTLLHAAGQPLGISICFEDTFARDVRIDLPEATLLVNVSNDAWFDGSFEPFQHHAIARMRALESGRFMLRATNTGISSVINPKGKVIAISPQFEVHVLKARVQPMQGTTPYVFWGDLLLVLSCLGVLGAFAFKRKRANF